MTHLLKWGKISHTNPHIILHSKLVMASSHLAFFFFFY